MLFLHLSDGFYSINETMLDVTTALVFGFVALLGYWFLGRKTSKLPPGIYSQIYSKLEFLFF